MNLKNFFESIPGVKYEEDIYVKESAESIVLHKEHPPVLSVSFKIMFYPQNVLVTSFEQKFLGVKPNPFIHKMHKEISLDSKVEEIEKLREKFFRDVIFGSLFNTWKEHSALKSE
jgi:hypothetical protein